MTPDFAGKHGGVLCRPKAGQLGKPKQSMAQESAGKWCTARFGAEGRLLAYPWMNHLSAALKNPNPLQPQFHNPRIDSTSSNGSPPEEAGLKGFPQTWHLAGPGSSKKEPRVGSMSDEQDRFLETPGEVPYENKVKVSGGVLSLPPRTQVWGKTALAMWKCMP